MPLPDFLVIGAMKCATTSLYNYLKIHPQISMPPNKSLSFFNTEDYFNGTWLKGSQWYESHFRDRAKVNGEVSTAYTKYPLAKGVPARIQYTMPNVKLIYVIRDPVTRAISHYLHNGIRGHEVKSIRDCLLSDEASHYLNCSRYHSQIQQFLIHFKLSQLLVITTEALESDARDTVQRVFSFLGVDHSFSSPDYHERHNTIFQNISCHRRKTNNALPSHITQILRKLTTLLSQDSQRICQRIPLRFEAALGLDHRDVRLLILRLSDDVRSLRLLLNCEFQEWRYGY